MGLEKERVYGVDQARMPILDDTPYKDMEQVYFTPLPADCPYPEIAKGEWRVRQVTLPDNEVQFTSTVKFGSKASGTRREIEIDLDHGDFGTKQADLDHYGLGLIRKRRYSAPDAIEVDQFDKDLHGPLWLAEREFKDDTEAATWQPPDWCLPLDRAPSNRELAVPLPTARLQELPTLPREQVIEQLAHWQGLGHKLLVTVSGMSGSGKSTLAASLAEQLGGQHIETDNFHIGATALQARDGVVNHDLPTTYDYKMAAEAAVNLLNGEAVTVPTYDFVTAEPTADTQRLEPPEKPVVVVEGLYAALVSEHAQGQAGDIRTFDILMNTPLYACVLRRMLRETTTDPTGAIPHREVSMSPAQTLHYVLSRAIPTYLANAPANDTFDTVVR